MNIEPFPNKRAGCWYGALDYVHQWRSEWSTRSLGAKGTEIQDIFLLKWIWNRVDELLNKNGLPKNWYFGFRRRHIPATHTIHFFRYNKNRRFMKYLYMYEIKIDKMKIMFLIWIFLKPGSDCILLLISKNFVYWSYKAGWPINLSLSTRS